MNDSKMIFSGRLVIALTLLFSHATNLLGQRIEESRIPGPPTQLELDRGKAEYQITENGPHHRKWERIEKRVNEQGEAEEIIRHYTELGTGLNRWDTEKEEWVESSNVIEAFEGGAVAQGGQTKVIFSPTLGDAAGTVDILTSDGQRIRTVVLGLAYYDPVSGEDAILSEVNPDVVGEIIPPNKVIYRDAFTDIDADVVYEYRRSGFSQNVVLHENLLPPEIFGLSELSRLEVLSEILEAPRIRKETRVVKAHRTQPNARPQMAEPDLVDETIYLGEASIGQGKAFEIGGPLETEALVTKRWSEVDGRTILFEGVYYEAAKAALEKLPSPSLIRGRPRADAGSGNRTSGREIPNRRLARAMADKDLPLRIASVGSTRESGYLIDYELLSGSLTDYVFESGKTYFVSNSTHLNGDTVFEGGAVIKIHNSIIYLDDPAVFSTSQYQLLIITSRDDDTVGETISGSTGVPPTLLQANGHGLNMRSMSNQTIQHVRVKHAYMGLVISSGVNIEIRDIQLLHCYFPFLIYGGSTGILIGNGLIDNSKSVYVYDAGVSLENLTVHDSDSFSAPNASATNCLLVEIGTFGNYGRQGSSDNVELSSASGVFQSAGNGDYYLANSSPYRDIGTSSIDPDLAAELETRTTHPPTVLANPTTLITNTTWTPHVARDDDGNLDIGYHYPAVDYITRPNCSVAAGVTLTVEAGAAVAVGDMEDSGMGYNDVSPLILEDGARLELLGEPENRIVWTSFSNVQEQSPSFTNGVHSYFDFLGNSFAGSQSHFTARWVDVYGAVTRFHSTTLTYHVFYRSLNRLDVRDSSFFGCDLFFADADDKEYRLLNNLFFRSDLTFTGGNSFYVHNNLFYGGVVSENMYSPGAYSSKFHDNVFHDVSDNGASSLPSSAVGYNAYLDTSFRLGGGTQSTDHVLSSLAYETGPFGDYYQPSTSPLIDAGSQPADAAGLLHHTVLTTGPPEGTGTSVTTVDIGLHYPAVDSGTGALLDQDGDGYANVVEDLNGNGQHDSGESNWQTVTSGLQVFTPLK